MKDHATLWREACSIVGDEAAVKLERPLTALERDALLNLGSFQFLESVERSIVVATSPQEVERLLAGLPRRGDPSRPG